MKPRTLEALWMWAYQEGKDAIPEPPIQLHARDPYPEKDSDLPETQWDIKRGPIQKAIAGIIVGRPFTRAFARYLDDEKAMTPIRRALRELKPRKGPYPIEYRILHAIVEGGYASPAQLAPIEGCSVDLIETAGHRALIHLYDKTQKQIEDEPRRTADTSVLTGQKVAEQSTLATIRRSKRPRSHRATSAGLPSAIAGAKQGIA